MVVTPRSNSTRIGRRPKRPRGYNTRMSICGQRCFLYTPKNWIWFLGILGMVGFLELRQIERAHIVYDVDDDDFLSFPFEKTSGSAPEKEKANKTLPSAANKSESAPLTLLESYYYAQDPIIPPDVYEPRSANPLPCIYIGMNQTDVYKNNWIIDGIQRSRYLHLAKAFLFGHGLATFDTDTKKTVDSGLPKVYIADWASLGRNCFSLEKLFAAEKVLPGSFLVYLDCSSSFKVKSCPKMERIFDKSRIRIAKQSIVKGRYWNLTKGWVEPGAIQANHGDEVSGGAILHAPPVLRETFVEKVTDVLGGHIPSIAETVYQKPRASDISHFWRKGDYSHFSFLRHEISAMIIKYPARTLNRILGDEDGIEQDEIQPDYVKAMLKSKIVVVAQKDEWEGHHRLFESMASGALVFSDNMLALPHGLRNRTNIVIYDGHSSLKRQLKYYLDQKHEKERLDIARRGWKYVMGKHRSWHRLEGLLFGMARTLTNKPEDAAPVRTA